MIDLLPPWPLFSTFLMASLVLALTPGPGVLYIVARSLVQGRRSGMVSVAGVALGNLGNAAAAAFGLAALMAMSALLYTAVKFAGAAYLIYLGVQMLRSAPQATAIDMSAPSPLLRIFREGFFVALVNPKTTLFFAAFLPPFVGQGGQALSQFLSLGIIFVAIAATTDSVYALAAGVVAPLVRNTRAQRLGPWLGAIVFIGLGLFTAFADRLAGV